MGEREQVNVRVSESQKASWEDYADEYGYSSVSDLIRVATQREVHGGASSESTSLEGASDIRRDLQSLEAQVSKLADSMVQIESDFHELAPVSNFDPRSVYEVLPTEQSDALTEEEVAHELGISTSESAANLAQLRHEVDGINVAVVADDVIYWRES